MKIHHGGNNMHRGNIITKEKEDDDMSAYVKPIQATPTLSGKDA